MLYSSHLFVLAQYFSIGFKSGGYRGRKITLELTDSISSFVLSGLTTSAPTARIGLTQD